MVASAVWFLNLHDSTVYGGSTIKYLVYHCSLIQQSATIPVWYHTTAVCAARISIVYDCIVVWYHRTTMY